MVKKIEVVKSQEMDEGASMQYLPDKQKIRWSEKLLRNFFVVALLTLLLSAIHNEQLPSGNTVMTAVQEIIDTPWDESLGKISFVSNMFPDVAAVFFSDAPTLDLIAPCMGEAINTWTKATPYLSYMNADLKVYAPGNGQIMSIAYGERDEKVIRIRHTDGIESIIYGLSSLYVQEGNSVTCSTIIGEGRSNTTTILEMRKDGVPFDPTELIRSRGASMI